MSTDPGWVAPPPPVSDGVARTAAAETPSRPARRTSLAFRISLLATAVAVITAVLAGLLAIGLVSKANQSSAHGRLARLADAEQTALDAGATTKAAIRQALQAVPGSNVQWALLDTDGRFVSSSAPLARRALTAADLSQLAAGQDLSTTRVLAGSSVLVEGRPLTDGAFVLVQRRADATRADDRVISRIVIALAAGVVAAILLGSLVAYRIARPLQRTAAAAHALAEGRRDVRLGVDGPFEVAEVGAAVNTLARALSVSEARQREFLLSVSHDLRTPLTAISGYAESLAEGVVPPEETAGVGRTMLTEAQRLNRLVADLLDLARLDAQEFRIDLAWVDVAEVGRAAAAVWADRCARVGVRFSAELPPAPVYAHTDPSRLRQVLDGLFDNALRVTPAGAPIVLAVRAEAGGVVAEVRDGGPGLTEDDLAVAFDRSALYDRYRAQRQVGTGLGLAIVHGLVTRLGGTVEAGHAPESGARFTVRL